MNTIQWQKSSASPSEPPAKQGGRSMGPSSNLWFGVSLGLLGIIIGYTAGNWTQFSGYANRNAVVVPPVVQEAQSSPSQKLEDIPAVDFAKDHYKGSAEATIALVEYTDYQCPYCKRAHPTFQKLVDDYDGKVVWVMRHFPLTSIHPNALPAAEAAECVAAVGGNEEFWTFTDAVMAQDDPFQKLPELAEAAGVDRGEFAACVQGGTMRQKIQDEAGDGSAAGVQGTPTTFVMNLQTKKTQIVGGAVPYESFKSAIDGLL
ncbi:MAG: thioredoxin domain-containing protein [Patescibacteria group bacterium]